MAEIRQTICDNEHCHAVKHTENHWWMLWIDGQGELHLRPMRDKSGKGVLTFCGEPCAMKKLSEFMSRAKVQRKDSQRQAWIAIGATKSIELLPDGQSRARVSSAPAQ